MDAILAISAALCFAFVFSYLRKRDSASVSYLPPGPRALPIVGNAFDIPTSMPWKAFRVLSNIYGDVLFLRAPTQSIVVLGSATAALDLLEKRSDVYSSRHQTVMTDLLLPRPWNFALMGYTSQWRIYRREFHQYFNQHAVLNYRPIQLQQSRAFLQRALDNPSKLAQHVRLIYAAIILKIMYDMDVTDIHDEYVRLAESAIGALSMTHWVPGAYFKKWIKKFAPVVDRMVHQPFYAVKIDLAAGKAKPSVAATMIEKIYSSSSDKDTQESLEEIARGVTGLGYGAAADTTAAAAQSFFIAMSLYPDVQRRAQEELDRVVGPHRLPDFEDYDNLVYIQAVTLESMRWMPVTPIGVPHGVIRDDEYRGFHIPKDTMVIANQWAMLHNPEDYPEPERFNPDRFIKAGKLNPDVRNPLSVAFGFGRRICPGRWLSSSSLYITIASSLHTLNVIPVVDPDGRKYDPANQVIEGVNLVLDKLPCTVTPRSEKSEQLIRQGFTIDQLQT